MTLIEKFRSFEDFDDHFRKVLGQLIPMNEHLYFALFHPTWCPDIMDLVRIYFDDPTSDNRDAIKNEVRAGYVRMLQSSTTDLLPPAAETIDSSLLTLMSGDRPTGEPYPQYLFPYPKGKFQQRFYETLFPGATRQYLAALQSCGILVFKKNCVIVTDLPMEERTKEALLADPVDQLLKMDLAQLIADLQENALFYKDHYEKAVVEQASLRQMIDSLSEQISTQTLTRWY